MSIKDISVLVIEDDDVNRKILNILLTKTMGIRCVNEWPHSGDFVGRLRSLSPLPDLIIMDIMISPYDGYEMIKQIRTHHEFDDVKIVAHTAGVMRDQVKELRSSRFDGLISKPITRELFPQLISRILKGESIWYIS
ncbi:MAG: response regulator [Chloroflexota bacterium]